MIDGIIQQIIKEVVRAELETVKKKIDQLAVSIEESAFPHQYYSLKEVESFTGISTCTLHRYKDEGKLPFVKVGKLIRIKAGDIKRLMANDIECVISKEK